MTERLVGPDGAFSHDWKARVGAPVSQSVHANRGGSLPRPEPSFDVDDVEPGDTIEHNLWTVKIEAAHHVEPWLESLAYRVDSDEGGVVFAGDTGPCESIVALSRGADVLVVNCWDHQESMEENGEAPGQTGTLDAARMALEAGVGKLILTHTGPHLCAPGSREKGIADIARIYTGEIVFGDELMRIPL